MNPEAGDHAITSDPVEWAAAQAAARRSWAEFPYYARRYGERGWRFTLSDSGWIAMLCSLPPGAVPEQLAWLQGLLVPRGMPSRLLEWHLVALHEELVAGSPDEADRYAVLAHGAAVLREERVNVLPEARFLELAAAFERDIADVPGAFPRMGEVLVAATIDDVNGYPGAIAAVLDWATDPARFPPAWRHAVDQCVRHARAEARSR